MGCEFLSQTYHMSGFVIFATLFTVIAAALGRMPAAWAVMVSVPALAYYVLEGEGFAVVNPSDALKLMNLLVCGSFAIAVVGKLRQEYLESRVILAQRNAQLESANREIANATTLLHELTHRVGNDLGTLSSIASIRALEAHDSSSAEDMRKMRDRINVFGCLYRKLAIYSDRAELDTKKFIEGICHDLHKAHSGLMPVALRTDVDDIQLDPHRAVLVGLMLNETITNAYKYAFPGDRTGSIIVNYKRTNGAVCLTVTDDGVGLEPTTKPANATGGGVGRKIIHSMAVQLRGDFSIVRAGDRTVARMSFPEK